MLALGAALSANIRSEGIHCLFRDIAAGAMHAKESGMSITVLQGQLLLAVYHLVLDNQVTARFFCGNALQSALGQGLNLEPRLDERASLYGLMATEMEECCRRTFWSIYMVEVSIPTRNANLP